MFTNKTSASWIALSILLLAPIAPATDDDPRPSFGQVDPAYRSAHPDTAWFILQPGDDPAAFEDPDARVAVAQAGTIEPAR